MEIRKIKTCILAHIKHDMRELPEGKKYGNTDVVPTLSCQNYGLINRGNSEQINEYRKNLEKGIFKYKRKGLIHALEACIQCPSDCPEDKRDEFFKHAYNYFLTTLPAGEKCVLLAQVHKDERKYTDDGTLISKDHLHILYVPMVTDNKHEDYEWKLSAHDLSSFGVFRRLHPNFQAYLSKNFLDEDKNPVPATVYQKKEGDGKAINLSVKELKEITDKTGIVLNKSVTVEGLLELLQEKHISVLEELSKKNEQLHQKLNIAQVQNKDLNKEKNVELEAQHEENQRLIHAIEILKNQIKDMEQTQHKKEQEISQLTEKYKNLEAKLSAIEKAKEVEKDAWGYSSWDSDNSWGTENSKEITEEKIW